MLGVNLLVRLGRSVLAGPVADAGLLPAGYYRHLILTAIEAEDFPAALRHLKWSSDPLLAQILIFRLRLLAAQCRRELEALQTLLEAADSQPRRENYAALMAQESLALGLLQEYETRALTQLAKPG